MKNLKIHPASNFYAEVAVKSSLIRASLRELYPELVGLPSILVQSFPTLRIQLPDNISVFEFHKDSFYRHPENEINNFLALTDSFESSALWRETSYTKSKIDGICPPTYRPVNLSQGEIIKFNTSKFWHGDLPNLLSSTRVSVDFRILVHEQDLSGATTLSGKKRIAIGSYYNWFNLSTMRFGL